MRHTAAFNSLLFKKKRRALLKIIPGKQEKVTGNMDKMEKE